MQKLTLPQVSNKCFRKNSCPRRFQTLRGKGGPAVELGSGISLPQKYTNLATNKPKSCKINTKV